MDRPGVCAAPFVFLERLALGRVDSRGRRALEGLALPRLDADGGLSPERFPFPEEAPPGEIGDDGGKRFRVTVRVRDPEAREVPPLAFSHFNPVSGAYQTVRSPPIALSVAGSAVVGPEAVVAAATAPPAREPAASKAGGAKGPGGTAAEGGGADTPGAPATLVGADLSLSAPGLALRRAADPRAIAPWLLALYGAPLAILAVEVWRRRTAARRGATRERRCALERCLAAIEAARDAGSAGEAAGRIAGALRELRRTLEVPTTGEDAFLQRCEREAFDPAAAGRPPSGDLDGEAADLARRWARSGPVAGARGRARRRPGRLPRRHGRGRPRRPGRGLSPGRDALRRSRRGGAAMPRTPHRVGQRGARRARPRNRHPRLPAGTLARSGPRASKPEPRLRLGADAGVAAGPAAGGRAAGSPSSRRRSSSPSRPRRFSSATRRETPSSPATALEVREDWTRIELADGTRGWISTSALGRVAPRPSS